MTIIRVRAQPKASRNEVVEYRDDVLRVRVTAPPEDGKANAAVIVLLAESLGIARSRVRLTRGHASRDKLVEVESMDGVELRRRLGIG
jgi:uncharacterized protein (TIGR00251 family)